MNTSKTPTQLTSINKMLTTLAAGLISIIGLRYIGQDLIAPVLMAIFLAVLMYPAFKFFRSRGFSSLISMILMITTMIVVVGSLVVFLTWSFSLLRDSLSTYTTGLSQTIDNVVTDETLESTINQYLTPELAWSMISSFLGSFGNIFTYLIIIPMLAMMIVIQIDYFSHNPQLQISDSHDQLARYRKFASSITVYAYGRLKVNIITGLMFTAALLFLDIDFALVWGVLTIFLSFIPYIGIVIAGTPPTLLALSQGGWLLAAAVIIAIIIINLIAENVFEPMIQGKGNKLSTPSVIVALIFWSWMLGAFGAIMAVPLTVLLKTVLADYSETAWIAAIMEGNYSLPDENSKSLFKRASSSLGDLIPKREKKS